jgi:O-antigen/teichoic acid export membrane protein
MITISSAKNAVLRRLLRSFSAQGALQIVQLAIRFGEVPLLIHYWGVERYGQWLMIAAIPYALTIADGGFAKATQREMAIHAAQGNRAGVLIAFQSGWAALLLISTVALILVVSVLAILPHWSLCGSRLECSSSFRAAILLMCLQTIVALQCSMLYGGFVSVGRYATATLCQASAHALGFVGLVVAVVLGSGVDGAALGFLSGWTVAYAGARMALKAKVPDVVYGFASVKWSEIKRLSAPSAANIAFPIGEALNIQGMRLLIGVMFGPLTLAGFSATRTLCRTALQPVLSVARAIEPEISLTHGSGNTLRIKTLVVNATVAAILLALTLAALLALVAPWVFKKWTLSNLPFSWPLFLLLATAGFLNAAWSVAMSAIAATNRHSRLAWTFLLVYGPLVLGLTWALGGFLGPMGSGVALVAADLVLAILVLRAFSLMAGLEFREWLKIALNLDRFRKIGRLFR